MADMKCVALLILVVMAPTATIGQAAITGTVPDSSDAALATVMLDASSADLLDTFRTFRRDDGHRGGSTRESPRFSCCLSSSSC